MLWFVLFLIVIVGNILRITITNFYKSSSAEYAELMKEKKELEREIIEEHLFIGSLIAITSIIIIVFAIWFNSFTNYQIFLEKRGCKTPFLML